ncbi:MAG: hypothetical protein IJ678_03045, partial [Kiritimatiellae bacterium]|nr:hypothetical protein [Kiritimatiellia bacterium]
TDAPVRLSVALDPAEEGRLSLVCLAFRSWNESPAAPSQGGAAAQDRFAGTAPSVADGENLDVPTWLRRNLHVSVS